MRIFIMIPGCKLFVDDGALVDETRERISTLKRWRENLKTKGLRISRKKNEICALCL